MVSVMTGLSPELSSVLAKLPKKAPTPVHRDPIWTALNGDSVSIRFGNTEAPLPELAAPSLPETSPSMEGTTAKLESDLPSGSPEAKTPAAKRPLSERIKTGFKRTALGVFGVSALATVGAPVAYFNSPAPSALVKQADDSAQLWQDVKGNQGLGSKSPISQRAALLAYMTDLMEKSDALHPEQPKTQFMVGLNLTEKELTLVGELLSEAKKAATFQDTQALFNRFADEYLVHYNNPTSVAQSKANVAEFFAKNKAEIGNREFRNDVLLNAFLIGLGGTTVTGAGLALARRKSRPGAV